MYIPKNKISTNLYSRNDDLVYKFNQKKYTGYYYKTYDGKYFTGKNPNDGVNDDFRLFFQPDTKIVSFEMLIYDRWGKQVFQTNTNEVGWNGNINGILANSGVYIYHFRVEYIDENGPGKDFKSGNISLIR